jgi:class 3 adenylate cyclase
MSTPARFDELLEQVLVLLRAQGRVSYAALRRRFDLGDEDVEALRDELVAARRVAVDEERTVLVWRGGEPAGAGAGARAETQAAPERAAERRQLTVMFCDIVGSTALAARLDMEELRELVHACQNAAVAAITPFRGHVAQYLGDGLLVYFGWPHAHDDDAPRAVHAALAVLDAIRVVNERSRGAGRPPIELRIGIHTGPVVVGEAAAGPGHERLALGETPNVAARLQSLAEPGAVLVSAATLRLLEERFFTEDLGPRQVKGLPGPLRVHRITGETGIRSRFDVAAKAELLPLVGRDAELGRLVELWESARSGRGRLALLSGEPGIGKSRLVQALKQHVSAQDHRWGSLRCSPYFAATPLYPVTELWRQAMEFSGAFEPAARLAWLERQLAHHGFESSTAVPLFADLLGIPVPAGRYPVLQAGPEERREQAIEGVIRITFGLAAERPFLLVVEDLHWVDPTTAELLRRLAERAAGHALLAVYTSRPRIEHDCGRAHVVALEIGRLSDEAADAMLASLAAGRPLTADVVRTIRQRADGVPAFVEELGRFVLETGGAGEGSSPAGIPATLRDSLMGRLDRTGEAKQIAQLAATIGRWFSERLIAAVAHVTPDELAAHLDKLVAARLLVREGDSPWAVYRFRHALMQELAYDSLLKRSRVSCHLDIATTLEACFPELVALHPELVAHHYAAAGKTREAIEYYRRAREYAQSQFADAEDRVEPPPGDPSDAETKTAPDRR